MFDRILNNLLYLQNLSGNKLKCKCFYEHFSESQNICGWIPKTNNYLQFFFYFRSKRLSTETKKILKIKKIKIKNKKF